MISGHQSFVELARKSLEDSGTFLRPSGTTFRRLSFEDSGTFRRPSESFKRASRNSFLGQLKEDADEPPGGDTPYTSTMLRLAEVEGTSYVEWARLGNNNGLSIRPLWQIDDDSNEDGTTVSTSAPGLDTDHNSLDELDEYFQEDGVEACAETEQEHMLKKLAHVPYTLMAFGRKSDAELIRLLFVTVGEKYTERNVIEEELDHVLDNTPYQTLPVITKGNFCWGGSEAIARMLARKFYLMGQTNHEHLIVEAMFERFCKMKRNHSSVMQYLTAVDIKKRDKLDWVEHQLRYVILPPAMAEWEKLITSSKGPYIVESGMTLADLAIVDFLDQCRSKINIKDLLVDCYVLADLAVLVKKHPRIGTYLDERDEKDKGRKHAATDDS